MPDAAMAEATQVASQGQGQGQPPVGSSPATKPTPNAGYEAAARQRVAMAVKALSDAVPLVGAASELGMAISSVIKTLAKFSPPGTASPSSMDAQLKGMLAKNAQGAQQMQSMQQGGGAPPQMMGGQGG